MSGAAHNPGQEFWQPPVSQAVQTPEPTGRMVEVCDRCGAEFVMGSRYCHVCGWARSSRIATTTRGVGRHFRTARQAIYTELRNIREGLGLGTASLLALTVGMLCLLGAIFTGVVFTATTVLDWQAVQLWRIEWLLGASTAFLAGILLKKRPS